MSKSKRTARKMSCHCCRTDLTAKMETTTRKMGNRGERTFDALKAPFRIEVTIRFPGGSGDFSKQILELRFCEACRTIPETAAHQMKNSSGYFGLKDQIDEVEL